MLHHFRLALAFGAILFFNLSPCAHAEVPKVPTQVPAYYRIQLGQFEITALQDGFTEHDTKVLQNINETDVGHLLSRMFVGNPKMQTSVNTYLINTGTNLVLVDAGAAKMARPRWIQSSSPICTVTISAGLTMPAASRSSRRRPFGFRRQRVTSGCRRRTPRLHLLTANLILKRLARRQHPIWLAVSGRPSRTEAC